MIKYISHNAGLGDSDHECINFTSTCYEEGTYTIKTTNYFNADYVTIRERLDRVNWVSQLRGNFLTACVSFKCAGNCYGWVAYQSMKMLKIRKISI